MRVWCVLAAVVLGGVVGGCNSGGKSDTVVINAGQAQDDRVYEYKVIRMDDAWPKRPMTGEQLEEARQAARRELEPKGWEYVGTELSNSTGKPSMFLFRKPAEQN